MIVVLWVTNSTVQWRQEAVLGSGKQRPRAPHPMNTFQNVIFNASQWKNPQLIQKDFHKTLTNVKQYLKNTKEDAQIFSACTGSAWWEQIQAGTVEIGQEVSQKGVKKLYLSSHNFLT